MSSTVSPNMNLIIPTVGQEPGPDFADDINASLTLVDQHDHSPGKGTPITPAGMNINDTLDLNENLIQDASGINFIAQSSTPDINTVYVNGVDAYFVDGLGNNIRLTQSGGVAGTPGSIANLVAPASATYVAGSKTFVWQSGTGIAANMDAAALLMRNITPNSTYALTLRPPTGLSQNYTVTLPTAPLATSFLQMDSSGTISGTIPTSHGLTDDNIAVGTQLPLVIQSKTSAYTVLETDGVVLADATSAGFTVTMYDAQDTQGKEVTIRKTDSTLNVVTISLVGAATTSTTLNTQGEEVRLITDGANWIILSRYVPAVWNNSWVSFGAGGSGITAINSQVVTAQRVGASLRIRARLNLNVAAATGYITLPSGIALDPTYYTSSQTIFGMWVANQANNLWGNTSRIGAVFGFTGNTDRLYFALTGTGDNLTEVSGGGTITWNAVIASGSSIAFDIVIPVSGWNG